MDAKQKAREEKKARLLEQLAEIAIEEQREAGVYDSTPHFSVIEQSAHELGRRVSRTIQERASREAAAESAVRVACPGCGELCPVHQKIRPVESGDGTIDLTENVADCRRCRRSFFPSAGSNGV